MPHCCPQKQQCVFTSRSAGCRDSSCQPPGGVYAGCGPNLSSKTSGETGGSATRLLLQAQLSKGKRVPLTGGTQFLPGRACSIHSIVKTELRQNAFQIVDVHTRSISFAASFAFGRFAGGSRRLI